jgi:hypothetical protein
MRKKRELQSYKSFTIKLNMLRERARFQELLYGIISQVITRMFDNITLFVTSASIRASKDKKRPYT